MVRKFLALLGLLVSLSVILPASAANARIYNQEIADATNQVRAVYHLSEDDARALTAGWPPKSDQQPVFVTPVVTTATPSIWQGMKARLEALEAAGVDDSDKRVALATSPSFVFPEGLTSPAPLASASEKSAAPVATQSLQPQAEPVAVAAPAGPAMPATQAASEPAKYGAHRTVLTPITQTLESGWYWFSKGGWLTILYGLMAFIALAALTLWRLVVWSRNDYDSFYRWCWWIPGTGYEEEDEALPEAPVSTNEPDWLDSQPGELAAQTVHVHEEPEEPQTFTREPLPDQHAGNRAMLDEALADAMAHTEVPTSPRVIRTRPRRTPITALKRGEDNTAHPMWSPLLDPDDDGLGSLGRPLA